MDDLMVLDGDCEEIVTQSKLSKFNHNSIILSSQFG